MMLPESDKIPACKAPVPLLPLREELHEEDDTEEVEEDGEQILEESVLTTMASMRLAKVSLQLEDNKNLLLLLLPLLMLP